MSILGVVLVLVVIGVFMWFVNNKIPMDGTIKTIINLVVLFVVLFWLAEIFGLLSTLGPLNRPINRAR